MSNIGHYLFLIGVFLILSGALLNERLPFWYEIVIMGIILAAMGGLIEKK